MARILSVICIVGVIGLAACGLVTLYDETMQAGRMWETPAIKPHEAPLPVMDPETVPFERSERMLQDADLGSLHSPLALNHPETIVQGQQAYQYYCIQCHGRHYDGNGTVGQSFAPLPGDLRSARVQALSPGRLFHEISYGIPGGRQPALAATMTEDERWQVVGLIRSLGTRP